MKQTQTKKTLKKSSESPKQRILTGITDAETHQVFLQCLTDKERLTAAETLEDFLDVLDDISPYWQKHSYDPFAFDAGCVFGVVWTCIVEHNKKTMLILPDLPRNWKDTENWAVSVRKLSVKFSDAEMPHTKALQQKQWAEILKLSPSTIYRMRTDDTKNKKYHFKPVTARRWSLPISEVPAKLFEKYKVKLDPCTR